MEVQATQATDIKYSVGSVRAVGLQARWTRTRAGAPIIAANAGAGWYVIDVRMWERAKAVGIKQAFEEHTALGRYFSVPA